MRGRAFSPTSLMELDAADCKLRGMNADAKIAALESFNEIATVRIELRGTAPLIWREVEVPTSVTLKVMHDIIQAVMGWFDYHLWEFTVAKRRYVPSTNQDWGREPGIEATKVRLRDVLKSGRTTLAYIYDFGDFWDHEVTVTSVRQAEPGGEYPRYVGGECNAPPEDCGGISGFYETLEAIANADHPNHADAVEWFDEYDPKLIDDEPIKYALSRIARRRNAAAARLGSKKPAPIG
jgi:hypothetical protein